MKNWWIGFSLIVTLAWGVGISAAREAAAAGTRAERSCAGSKTENPTPRRSMGRVLSDVTITSNVKTALMQDKQVEAREINVDTVKGVVHLKGKVDSKAEARKAVALARRVDGVKGVKSHLKVVPDGKPGKKSAAQDRSAGRVMADVTLTSRVKTALMQDKQVEAREINVDTVKGIVYLKGKVDSKAEAQKAVMLARKVDGVKGVKNQLKIVPDEKSGNQ